MAYRSLVAAVDARTAERLSDALIDAGALAVSVEDARAGTAAEEPIFGEPGSPLAQIWAENTVRALLDESVDAAAVLAAASAAIGLASAPAYRVESVPDHDWVARTQAQFEPIRVSGRLWIVPSWHAPVDPRAINIVLDPGLAFGTGSHPTTQLCLRWLETVIHGGESVIDYGCGSGVLALAAAKLGAGRVCGVDIDPQAIVAASANAERNDVAATFTLADGPALAAAEVVVANILANPLKVLAPALAGITRRGGRLALAGLLTEQSEDVTGAYHPYFDMRAFDSQDGWTCLAGVRR